MRYAKKNIDGIFELSITDDLIATVTGDIDQPTVTIKLSNEAEATKIIAEFEDFDGELMQDDDSVFKKYPELAPFVP